MFAEQNLKGVLDRCKWLLDKDDMFTTKNLKGVLDRSTRDMFETEWNKHVQCFFVWKVFQCAMEGFWYVGYSVFDKLGIFLTLLRKLSI